MPPSAFTSPFSTTLSTSGRGHSGAEVQILGRSVLGGLPAARGDSVPVHRGAVPISCQPATGAWAEVRAEGPAQGGGHFIRRRLCGKTVVGPGEKPGMPGHLSEVAVEGASGDRETEPHIWEPVSWW